MSETTSSDGLRSLALAVESLAKQVASQGHVLSGIRSTIIAINTRLDAVEAKQSARRRDRML